MRLLLPMFAASTANTVLAFAPSSISGRRVVPRRPNHNLFSAMDSSTVAEAETISNPLLSAVQQMDSSTVSKLLLLEESNVLDEATTDAAFWAVVDAVDTAEANDEPLPADVPRMLHHIFNADMHHLLVNRAPHDKITTNVTCMQPKETGLSSHHQMSYIFDDSSHKDLPLKPGRRCEDGRCNCDACSRNIFPTFSSQAETSLKTFPELASLTFNDLKRVSTKTILQFTRLVERVRRTIAHEYGLPLSHILPLQAYSRKYVAGTTQQGGGGGEGDFVTLHTDEATHSGYHYSSVLYLSTQGQDFEGGDFVFNDPLDDTDASHSTADVSSSSSGKDEIGVLGNDDDDDDEEAAAAALFEKLMKGEELPDDGQADMVSSSKQDDHDEDDEEAAAAALMEKLLRGEELPDDSGDDVDNSIKVDNLVDNHWTDDDPEEYEDIDYYNTMKDTIRRTGRKLTPFHPTRGAAVIFSSGWENMHEVEKITSGVRYAVPCFFTTSPVPEIAYEQMASGKPKTDDDMADDWLHLLLAHREEETPEESVGRVKELLMKWHYICTPLSEH